MADGVTPSIVPAAIGLVGVLIGGIITAGSNYIIAVRKERADDKKEKQKRDDERKIAARLLHAELSRALGQLTSIAEAKVWIEGLETKLSTDNWKEYSPIMAGVLDRSSWSKLDTAYDSLASTVLALQMGASGSPVSELIKSNSAKINSAIKVLEAHL